MLAGGKKGERGGALDALSVVGQTVEGRIPFQRCLCYVLLDALFLRARDGP